MHRSGALGHRAERKFSWESLDMKAQRSVIQKSGNVLRGLHFGRIWECSGGQDQGENLDENWNDSTVQVKRLCLLSLSVLLEWILCLPEKHLLPSGVKHANLPFGQY